MSEHIIYHIADGIATLTLNRPKVLNAINYDLLKELDELLDQAAADDSLRVLILTGSGKAFAAGADIAQQAGMDQEEAAKWGRYGSGIFRRLECFPIPTLAVINGYALGGGCEMAMACDLILAGEKAKFGQPETGLGITPGFSGTQRLLRRVGVSKAKELIYTGRMIDAQEALQIGLADHIYPDDQLQTEALAMAKKNRSQRTRCRTLCKMCHQRRGTGRHRYCYHNREQMVFQMLCYTRSKGRHAGIPRKAQGNIPQ